MNLSEKVVVVCSLPRTGTHFLIDFLRKNFGIFEISLPVWASSEHLYINLDGLIDGRNWEMSSAARDCYLVKTHCLPFSSEAHDRLEALAGERLVYFLTPIRSTDGLLNSYNRYITRLTGSSVDLEQPDPYYRNGSTTHQIIREFIKWAGTHSTFVDVERAVQYPERLAHQLGEIFDERPRALERRLPRLRGLRGPIGELFGRVKGRESSEVIVPKTIRPSKLLVPSELQGIIEAARRSAIPSCN